MNQIYSIAREKFLTGQLDWTGDDIAIALLDDQYVFSDFDTVFDDLIGVIDTSGFLTGKTATGGVADADDVVFASVTGADIEKVVIFHDTGNSTTSTLIAYYDTDPAEQSIIVPAAGDAISVIWSNGPWKIFKL